MRKPFIAGNWKMYKTINEARIFAEEIKSLAVETMNVDVAICVPYLQLDAMKDAFLGTNVKIGAQNMHFEDQGAYTGEISAPMLKELNVDCCIIGHSERRQYFNETDITCSIKVSKALEYEITPILCIGENLVQRENGTAFDIVKQQLIGCLKEIEAEKIKNVVIAYEPIWAIGSGKTATSEQAGEMAEFIREGIREMFGEISERVNILYGGSIKPDNISEIMMVKDVDGALVGGASLKATDFFNIINYRR